ncbi:MAG: hypothetical protein ABTD50_12785 [Polyangiaceae bacterium]
MRPAGTLLGFLSTLLVESVMVAGPLALGVLGAIWGTQIADLSKWKWSGESIVFVSTAIITTFVSLGSALGRRAGANLAERAAKADRVARSLRESLPGELDSQPHDVGIRMVLQAITKVAWTLDGCPPEMNYGANVMVFSKKRPEAVHFCEAGTKMRGFLVLDRTLSATRIGAAAAPDGLLPEFGLPVPEDPSRCLPGAPLAFRDTGTDFYADTHRLARWCRKQGFSAAVQDEIRRYFSTDGKNVRSMLSVRLPVNSPSAPFAVLNLHRYRGGMFGDGAPTAEFVGIGESLFVLLGQRLAHRASDGHTIEGALDHEHRDEQGKATGRWRSKRRRR